MLVGVVGFLALKWSCLPLSPIVSGCLPSCGGWVLVGVAAFLGSEVVLSPVVSGCLPSCGGWVLVGVAASRTKTFRNQNHRFQSKFAHCKLFGVYAGVIFLQCSDSQRKPTKTQQQKATPPSPPPQETPRTCPGSSRTAWGDGTCARSPWPHWPEIQEGWRMFNFQGDVGWWCLMNCSRPLRSALQIVLKRNHTKLLPALTIIS